jgi:hypothetical protein
MGRQFIALLVLIGSMSLAFAEGDKKTAGTTSPPPPEGQAFGEMSHDFGSVPRGAQLLHRFQWRNTTDKPLELMEYQRSCGCTTVTISPRVVEPGMLGTIDLLMDTKPFAGDKTVSLSLVFGPGRALSGQFQVKAHSRGDIVYNPGQLTYGVLDEGSKPTQQLEIEYAGALEFKIENVVEKPKGVEVKVTEAYRRPGAVGYHVTATLTGDHPSGDFKHTVQLKTNDPANPILPVLLEGTVRSALTVVPDKLYYGTVKVGQVMNRRITLRSSAPFRVLGIDGQGNGVSAAPPESTASVHSLLIQWRPHDRGELHTELRIRTDNEKFPQVVLSVSGIAQ